jgi:hypothetical protein
MKKSILSIAIGLALFSTTFAKAPEKVNARVAASFQKDFNKASEVHWSATTNYLVASFRMDNETEYAYYDFQGNLIGLVHNMLTSSLPEGLSKDIKKHYSGYWVSELFQVSSDQGVYYYIQLTNADETIVLSTEGNGSWYRYAVPRTIVNL